MIYNYDDFRETIVNLSLARVFSEETLLKLYEIYSKNLPRSSQNPNQILEPTTQDYTNFKNKYLSFYNQLGQFGAWYFVKFYEVCKILGDEIGAIIFPIFLLDKIEKSLSGIIQEAVSPQLKYKMNTNQVYNVVIRNTIQLILQMSEKMQNLSLLSLYNENIYWRLLNEVMSGAQVLIGDTRDPEVIKKIKFGLTQLFIIIKYKATRTAVKAFFKIIGWDVDIEDIVCDLDIIDTSFYNPVLQQNIFSMSQNPTTIQFYFRPYNPFTDRNSITINPLELQTIITRVKEYIEQAQLGDDYLPPQYQNRNETEKLSKKISKIIKNSFGTTIIKTNISQVTFVKKQVTNEEIDVIRKIIQSLFPYYIAVETAFILIDFSRDDIEWGEIHDEDQYTAEAIYPHETNNPQHTDQHILELINTINTHFRGYIIPNLIQPSMKINDIFNYKLNQYILNPFVATIEATYQ